MTTRVVNVHTDHYDVFGARPGRLGNHYKAGGLLTREDVIALYHCDFLHRVDTDPEFRKYILSCRDKSLGCHCKPKTCHLDAVARWIDAQPLEKIT